MDARLTDEQRMLVDASTRFVEQQWPVSQIRDRAGVAASSGDYRRAAADLGWFGLLVPDELGGGRLSDNAVVDAVLVARVRGAGLQPGSFVTTNVVAETLAEIVGGDAQHAQVLTDLVSGRTSATWVAPEGDQEPGVRARRDGDAYVLTGTASAVPQVRDCEWVLVTAATDDRGEAQFLMPADTAGVEVVDLSGLDVTRSFADLEFTGARVAANTLVGAPATTARQVERQQQVAAVLTAAEMVGAMGRDFALALEYAKTRIAFGRPIGSFQAVKHLLADTSLMLEMSDAMLFAAARALGSDDPQAPRIVAMAKAFISDSGVELVHNCFQVFGGVGFTWEHDQHLYLRRVTTDAARYGDSGWHRERICVLAGMGSGQ